MLTRIGALTLVADGDGYVVGSPHSAEYVEVPELGARIIEWLQEGADVAECERRAAEVAGEPVDVPGFLATLAAEGLLDEAPGAPDGPGLGRRAGAALFHPLAWAVYALAALAAPVLLVAMPSLRPSYRDGFPFTTQLLNIVAVSALGIAAAAVHEGAHVLAAARHGLRSRLSVTRRLYFITFQADLTRLWSLPRRARYGPLLAGVAWDLVVLAAALLAQACLAGALGPVVVRLLRALVLLQVTALVAQLLVFMRTDVYALLVNATGCKTLWATKGALLRRYLRRATPPTRSTWPVPARARSPGRGGTCGCTCRGSRWRWGTSPPSHCPAWCTSCGSAWPRSATAGWARRRAGPGWRRCSSPSCRPCSRCWARPAAACACCARRRRAGDLESKMINRRGCSADLRRPKLAFRFGR
ncbi:hypothetical protein [Dactylosporangium darangshiense]|uniref:hypothetical protein n=1 Tax=Dactylosporangium darangshiense TaxID=579108 RepID=UPI0036305570